MRLFSNKPELHNPSLLAKSEKDGDNEDEEEPDKLRFGDEDLPHGLTAKIYGSKPTKYLPKINASTINYWEEVPMSPKIAGSLSSIPEKEDFLNGIKSSPTNSDAQPISRTSEPTTFVAHTPTSESASLKISSLFNVSASYLKGIIKSDSGDCFKGTIVHGLANGPGSLILKTGYSYNGGFKDDLRHGAAKELLPGGIKVDCIFEKGIKHGPFSCYFPDGSQFHGHFLYGEQLAEGEYVSKKKNVYKGDFIAGQIQGQGKVIYSNGDTFEGDFINSKRHGKGRLSLANGSVIEGIWVKDLQQGIGTIFEPLSANRYKALWKDGVLIQTF